jgi:hypothetical protein
VTVGDSKLPLSGGQTPGLPLAQVQLLSNPGKVDLETTEVRSMRSGSYLCQNGIKRFDDTCGRTN